MKQRSVEISDEAIDDLSALYDWIEVQSSPTTAFSYTERLIDFCYRLDLASERGQRRDDIRPGLRIVGFERRVTVAFTVEEKRVVILRLFYGGRDWTEMF